MGACSLQNVKKNNGFLLSCQLNVDNRSRDINLRAPTDLAPNKASIMKMAPSSAIRKSMVWRGRDCQHSVVGLLMVCAAGARLPSTVCCLATSIIMIQ